jgi:hypothetical protein
MKHKLKIFIESIDTNSPLMDVINQGYLSIFESLSTDDANSKPEGSVVKFVERTVIHKGIDSDDYFDDLKVDSGLSPKDKITAEKSKFGNGRVSKYPDSGRALTSTDPLTSGHSVVGTSGGSEGS